MTNKKIASEIAVGIILLIAVVVGGLFWLQNKSISKIQNITDNAATIQKPIQKEKETVMCTQEAKLCEDGKTYVSRTGPDCEFASCPKEANDETANWQTYKNEKYGFEFKYPSMYIVDVVSRDGIDDFVLRSESGGHWVYDIRVVPNLKNLSIDRMLDQQTTQKEERIMTDAFFAGIAAKRYSIKNYADYGNAGIIANIGSNSISLSGDDSSGPAKLELEAIIDTFKFVK